MDLHILSGPPLALGVLIAACDVKPAQNSVIARSAGKPATNKTELQVVTESQSGEDSECKQQTKALLRLCLLRPTSVDDRQDARKSELLLAESVHLRGLQLYQEFAGQWLSGCRKLHS